MVLKSCRKCRKIIEENDADEKDVIKECPICGGNVFTTFWKGMAVVIDPENSEVAKTMEIETPGRYALRLSR